MVHWYWYNWPVYDDVTQWFSWKKNVLFFYGGSMTGNVENHQGNFKVSRFLHLTIGQHLQFVKFNPPADVSAP